MSRRIWLIASAVAVLGLTAGGMAFASGRSGAAPPTGSWGRGAITPHGSAQAAPQGSETMTVITQQTQVAFIDADGSGSFSPGDYEVFTEDILDANTHAKIGADHAKCTFDFDAFVCDGTFTLFSRGDIAIEASLTDAPGGNFLVVTGGSFEFFGAGGEALLKDLGGGKTKFTFFLTQP